MAIFKGNPSGSPNKNYVTVICNRNYNVCTRDPPKVFSLSTMTICGHADDDAYWYAQESRGILMISYLLRHSTWTLLTCNDQDN